MPNLKLAPGVEIALLKRRIKALEHFLEASEHQVEELLRDQMQARRHPNMQAVYRAAMRIYLYRHPLSWSSTPVERLVRACARAAKMAKGKR